MKFIKKRQIKFKRKIAEEVVTEHYILQTYILRLCSDKLYI